MLVVKLQVRHDVLCSFAKPFILGPLLELHFCKNTPPLHVYFGDTNGHFEEHSAGAVGDHHGLAENVPGATFHAAWIIEHRLLASATVQSYFFGEGSSVYLHHIRWSSQWTLLPCRRTLPR